MPSPSESGLSGSVPSAISTALVRPSPSASPSGAMMVSVLFAPGSWVELPAPLLATRVNAPTASEVRSSDNVAERPSGATIAVATATFAGTNAGAKANVAPVRLAPVTTNAGTWTGAPVLIMNLGVMLLMAGTWTTSKLSVERATAAPTATETGPVVAPSGTIVVTLVAVACVTSAGTPLNVTAL